MNQTTNATTRIRLAVLASVLALTAAAGCGGSDGDDQTQTQAATTSPTTTSPTTTTTAGGAEHGAGQRAGGNEDHSAPQDSKRDGGTQTRDREGAPQPQPHADQLADLRQQLIDALTSGDPEANSDRIRQIRDQIEQLRVDSLSPEQQAQLEAQQHEQDEGRSGAHNGGQPGAGG